MFVIERPEKPRSAANHSIYSETGQRRRQRHQKSKNGCSSCRARRIKCDEAKPACAYCVRSNKTCRYPASTKGSSTVRQASALELLSQPNCDAWIINTSVQGYLLRALEIAERSDPDFTDFIPSLRRHALESLNHFVTCDLSWLKARKVQNLMQRSAIDLVINHQYLLHAVLAVSNAHLAFLKPGHASYAHAARIHWQHSLRSFLPLFQEDWEHRDADSIYFASQIHAILSFLLVRLPLTERRPQCSADWLVVMRYKRLIFASSPVVQQLRQGPWQLLVESHKNWLFRSQRRIASNADHTSSRFVTALMQFADNDISRRAPFHDEQLQYLMMLERVPPINDAIGAFLSFITEAPGEYIKSLQECDTLSLLMLLYWCTMVSKVNQWWLAEAAKAEEQNLVQHLLHDEDESLQLTLNVLVEGSENNIGQRNRVHAI